MTRWIACSSILIAAIVAACSGDRMTPQGCIGGAGVGPGATPGVVIQEPGIDLKVRDPFGRGQAIGTSAIVRRSDGSTVSSNVQDTLNILAAFDVAGTFSITLTRPYYQDATVTNVTVTPTAPNACSVNTTTVPVTLQLAAGAPPLRAMILVGAGFLDHAGAQVQLVPHFDADPGVSTAVTWAVSDATLATVDANGLVTAKCTTSGGTVKVTATSVVDASITNFVNMGVSPASTCP